MTDQVKCIETGKKIQLFVVTRKICMALERCGIHVLSAVWHTTAIESSLNVLLYNVLYGHPKRCQWHVRNTA